MGQPAPRNLTAALLVIFVLLAIGIGLAGSLYRDRQHALVRREKLNELAAIADLKVNQIAYWRQERLADGEVIRADRMIARTVEALWADAGADHLAAEIRGWMTSLQQIYDYPDAILFDAHGQIRLAGDRGNALISAYGQQLVAEALQTHQVILSDFHHTEPVHAIHLDLVAPLLASHGGELAAVGAILLRIDPHAFLYPTVQTWPVESATAETLLLRREEDEVVILNELRHRSAAAMALRLPARAPQLVALAAHGPEGPLEGADYRGVRVLGAVRSIPATPWRLVTKVDVAEVEAPLHRLGWLVGLLATALVAIAGAGVIVFGQRQQVLFHRGQRVAELARETALRVERDKAQQYLDIAGVIILALDRQGRITLLNRRGLDLLGYGQSELLGQDWFDACLPARLRKPVRAVFEQLIGGQVEGVEYYENPVLTKRGEERIIAWHNTMLRDDAGQVVGILSSGEDITERRRAEEALHALNLDLERRVRERTAQLEAANRQLKELDRLKSQFVSNVSHELRTPLANLKVYLHLLDEGKPEKRPQYMATLHREADTLHCLIEDLLLLSRMDQGRAQPAFAAVDVNRVATTLVSDRAALFTDRGLALRADLGEGLPAVQADVKMLTQVLTNLMTNAMNYTPAGGAVTVTSGLRLADDSLQTTEDAGRLQWVTLAVSDTGCGISAEEQAHLFERFYRGEAARQMGAPGAGLGLSICHEIVERHGGRITLTSQVGKGSTFTVWLPVGRQRLAPA